MLKLTCVTAVFNAISSGNRDSLVRCVESVSKLGTEHEHLIYDGVSKDGTVELLRELAQRTPGLKVVSEPDKGIYNALNKGVRDAKGEWFYVLGCDDYIIHPEVMDDLLHNVDAKCGMMVATVERNSGQLFFTGLRDLEHIAYSNPYSHQGVIMRTALVQEFGGFDEGNPISADYDMFWKAHKKDVGIAYSFKPFAFYARGGFSSDKEMCRKWDALVIQRHLNLTERQAADRYKKSFPVAKVLPLFRYGDFAIRKCAWRLLRDRFKFYIRIIFYPLVVVTRPLRYRNTKDVDGACPVPNERSGGGSR